MQASPENMSPLLQLRYCKFSEPVCSMHASIMISAAAAAAVALEDIEARARTIPPTTAAAAIVPASPSRELFG